MHPQDISAGRGALAMQNDTLAQINDVYKNQSQTLANLAKDIGAFGDYWAQRSAEQKAEEKEQARYEDAKAMQMEQFDYQKSQDKIANAQRDKQLAIQESTAKAQSALAWSQTSNQKYQNALLAGVAAKLLQGENNKDAQKALENAYKSALGTQNPPKTPMNQP